MSTVKLKIAELRKEKGIGQQELAEVLGVSFQSVSKWETGATMPDITLLPVIAGYFNVSVDELLGLKPLRKQAYIPRNTDNRDNWNGRSDYLNKNRKYFWNDDYLKFLIESVWHIESPIDVIDFRCGDGCLGLKLLALLPKGSTYTGINELVLKLEATKECKNANEKLESLYETIGAFLPEEQKKLIFEVDDCFTEILIMYL